MNFNFSAPQQIIFGNGRIGDLTFIMRDIGDRAFIVRYHSGSGFPALVRTLEENYVKWIEFEVRQEPNLALVTDAVAVAQKYECNFVVSIGGGSVIDTGKIVSVMQTNHGSIMDYLEVVGKGKTLENPAIPHIAIPTTAGTGTEVTRNAVLDIPEKKTKVSMRSDYLFPKIACVDPELTISVPPTTTAFSGMDAFSQVIEPFVSKRKNYLTDMFCRDGIRLASDYLIRAYHDGEDRVSRTMMSGVSLLGGLCLTNSGLGAIHGFAGPIGGMFHIPHGAICASLLPSVMEMNINALRRRDSINETVNSYKEIIQIVTKNPDSTIEEGIEWFKELNLKLQIPSLAGLGINKKDFSEIIERAVQSNSMKTNPIQLTRDELWQILELSN